ncbi:MAG: penicillin-binding protein 2 [Neisseriaceae bacterium]|nr:penicillin-binding protein 2 [Neisseriaceae bacterium]
MEIQRQFKKISSVNQNSSKYRFEGRLIVVFIFVIILFIVLAARFYHLQITQHEYYSNRARSNRISLLPTPPIRGEIVDTNGVVLARNYTAFSLEIIPNDLNRPLEEVIESLKNYVNITEDDLKRFRKFRTDYRAYDNIPLKMKLKSDEAGRLASELYRFPGVQINARTFREYPFGDLTAHFVGYIGRISQRDKDFINENNWNALYRGTTHIGKSGLEQFYEPQLHGVPGFKEVEKDAQGNIVRVLRTVPPKTGQMLKLGMDIRVQQEAHRILGRKRGAMVAIDPQSGNVLAFVSKPTFDPNLFIDGIDAETWNQLNNNWQRPLINRVTQGLYPPGSTFKPFMSMALLESGTITANSMIYSPGSWSLPGSRHQFRDSVRAGHGTIGLTKALQVSSDTFFYQLGYKLGIDKTREYLAPFGLGQKTGIDLPHEYIGVLPSREWKEKRFAKAKPAQRQWIPADMVSVSIGQGYNAYTPLQMAFATAILSADGKVYRPHLVSQILDYENRQSTIIEPEPSRIVPYKPEHFRYVKRGMQYVLQPGGTASKIGAGLKYSMAGKTGTAQVVRIKQGASYNAAALAERYRDHAWFIAFAPVEKPRIAVAVILENGGWGVNAAPLARQLIDYYLLQYPKEEKEDTETTKQTIVPAVSTPRGLQAAFIRKPQPTQETLPETAQEKTNE